MKNMDFDDLPQIIDISNEEIIEKKIEWIEIIGKRKKIEDINDVASEQCICVLEKNEENDIILYKVSDEIFFSSKINCITFFGVFHKSNARSSVFIRSDVINPYSIHEGKLYACGCIMTTN